MWAELRRKITVETDGDGKSNNKLETPDLHGTLPAKSRFWVQVHVLVMLQSTLVAAFINPTLAKFA